MGPLDKIILALSWKTYIVEDIQYTGSSVNTII